MPTFSNFRPKEITWNDGLGDVSVQELSDTSWKLLRPFSYTTLDGHVIDIPAGFLTDGASSPVVITRWGGKYGTAALIHDYLYTQLNHGHPNPAAPTRRDADDILDEVMRRCNVNIYVRVGIWLAVRAFGGPAMRKLGVR